MSSGTMAGKGGSEYEGFLGAVIEDFDSRLQVVQKSAEENLKAYEAYCGELKRQLECVRAERDQLQKKVESQRRVSVSGGGGGKGVEDLFTQMTALSVTQRTTDKAEVVYDCELLEGGMAGLQFTLSLDKASWEYRYEPSSGTSDATKLSRFATTLYFPDYMLSRFLTNLLNATYSQSPH